MEKIKIGGILCHENLAILRIQGMTRQKDAGAILLSEFGAKQVNIQFVVLLVDQNGHNQLTLAVDRDNAKIAFDLVSRFQKQVGAISVNLKSDVASIGIYGPDFRIRPGIAGNFLKCLSEQNISILAISTSVSTCSVLIPESEASKAKSALEAHFLLP